MKSLKRSFLCSAAVAAVVSSSAMANAADLMDPVPSSSNMWYVSIFGGKAHSHDFDSDTRYIGTGGGYHNKIDLENGFILGFAVGMEFAPNLRGEVEFARQTFDADTINYAQPNSPGTNYNAKGGLESYTILANVWYDVEALSFGGITPYVGGGLGYGHLDSNISYKNFPTYGFHGSDSGLAYQLGAGVNWAISSNLSLDLGYRFKGINGINLKGTRQNPAKHDFGNWQTDAFIVGLRLQM